MVDFFKTVTTTELTTQPKIKEFDVLARLSRSTSSNITTVATIDTHVFLGNLYQLQTEWQSDLSALNEVIEWQHRVIDFNSSYSAYLLEQISDDEFDKIAEEMATEEIDIPAERLAAMISKIIRLTAIDLTPSDFANLFHCSVDSVNEALRIPSLIKSYENPLLVEGL